MDITNLGHSCFKLRGKTASVICDPYDPEKLGLSLPKNLKADVVTVSHGHFDHSNIQAVKGNSRDPIVLINPGEYEVSGIEIVGVLTFHDAKQGQERGSNTVFRFSIDGITIAHLGDLGHSLTDSQLEEIGSVDVLLVPVGGSYTIDAQRAAAVVQQLEPKITIPMHYQRQGLKEDIFKALVPIDAFFKEIGKERVQPQPKLVLKKGSLPQEPQIVVLSD